MKKALLIGFLAILVVVGAGVFYLFSNLNSLVAQAIEQNGSAVTDTQVGVSGVDIKVRDGRGSISDLRVGSPEGFKATNVFELGNITVDLDVGSVREDPIVLDEVRIRAPVVHAELNEAGKLNLDELRKQVQSYGGGESGGRGAGDDGVQKRLRIAKFVFEEGRIEVDATAVGVEAKSIPLPEIRLSNVGGNQGAPPDEIAKIILTTFAKETASEIARSEVQDLIDDQLEESLGEEAKGLLDKVIN